MTAGVADATGSAGNRPALRADAERNCERIVSAARTCSPNRDSPPGTGRLVRFLRLRPAGLCDAGRRPRVKRRADADLPTANASARILFPRILC